MNRFRLFCQPKSHLVGDIGGFVVKSVAIFLKEDYKWTINKL